MSHSGGFKKYSGAGNTFLISKALGDKHLGMDKKQIADLCMSATKEPTDGLIYLHQMGPQSYKWDFYNQDGSSAEMCGNAARCVGAFLWNEEKVERLNLQTIAGNIEVQKIAEEFVVKMPIIRSAVMPVKLKIDEQEIWGRYIDSGVPHFVWEVDVTKEFAEFKAKAQTIRSHNFFRPRGTNVTLVKPQGNVVSAVTFERGVEDFTQACGTGAVAAARVLAKSKEDQFTIKMPGGDLRVSFDGDINQPLLQGPALFVENVNFN